LYTIESEQDNNIKNYISNEMRGIKMIEYYCDGSYKKEDATVACGIIRISEERKENQFYYTVSPYWFKKHEEFAIYRTLLLIAEKGDKNVTIWNDAQEVIDEILKKIKKEKWIKRLNLITDKLKQLKQNGYHIQIRCKCEKDSIYIKEVHKESRKYLENEKIREKIEKEKQGKKLKRKIEKQKREKEEEKKKQEEKNQERKKPVTKQTISEYLASVGIHYEEGQKKKSKQPEKTKQQTAAEREILRNAVVKLGEGKTINTKALVNSNQIYFGKISNKKWCVLNEKDELLYVNENLPHMIYNVTKETLQYKQTLCIHHSSKILFGSAVKSKKGTQKQYPEIYEQVQQWEEEGRIQFVL